MAKFLINATFLLSRRAYTVAAETVPGSSVIRKVKDSSSVRKGVPAKKEEIFWMRDPKTGNWIPESHFDDIDVAELREKVLPKKIKF